MQNEIIVHFIVDGEDNRNGLYCAKFRRTSYNTNDIKFSYCGACHSVVKCEDKREKKYSTFRVEYFALDKPTLII
jgi:hypothetical protein